MFHWTPSISTFFFFSASFAHRPLPILACYPLSPQTSPRSQSITSSVQSPVKKSSFYIPIRRFRGIVAISAAFLSQWVRRLIVDHQLRARSLLDLRLSDSGSCNRNNWNLFQLKRTLCLLRRCLHQMRHVWCFLFFFSVNYFSSHIYSDRGQTPKKKKRDGSFVRECVVFCDRNVTENHDFLLHWLFDCFTIIIGFHTNNTNTHSIITKLHYFCLFSFQEFSFN